MRRSRDNYPTPHWCFEQIYRQLPMAEWDFTQFTSALEPAAGDGRIAGFLEMFMPNRVRRLDIDQGLNFFQQFNHHLPWNPVSRQPRYAFDLIMTNPPYTKAFEFVQKSLQLAPTVIMLLRLGFLASNARADFLRTHEPTKLIVLSNRPSFTGNGTDWYDYAWFVWDRSGRIKPGITHITKP